MLGEDMHHGDLLMVDRSLEALCRQHHFTEVSGYSWRSGPASRR
jgi:hypothetical protein